jgi:zinc transport system substrate-binding protein
MLFHTVCNKNRARVKRPIRMACLCFFLMALCPGSIRATPQSTAPQLQIYTAIAPLAFIIAQIGGPHLSVETLLPPGQDPHLFEPEPRLLQRLSKADMYLMSGLPFERMLIQKITARQGHLAIIDLTAKISFWESGHSHGTHDSLKKNTDTHDHSGRDPHFWLGVQQLRQFITAAAGSICDADPGHAPVYKKNTARLLDRLDRVHT